MASAVDFQREVRPLLSDACFHCHGPDAATRMVGLRLDTREGAFEKRPNGAAIVPGDPDNSLVFQRISATDARRMPPAHVHKDLTAEQIETVRTWIAEGAAWSEHWSFAPPVKREPPAPRNPSWARNGIDGFVAARLDAEGLAPAQEADRRTLIRRVAFDLTGLPPSPADIDAFVNDTGPNAYERLVDRLLESPAWGEHRARYWLDAARYADTHGLHIDNYREMWPYRDWVIEAFNRNLSFDKFTLWQIAGDLLPNPTPEQLVATGFHRCNITTNEGGVIEEEVAAIYAKDRVDTTGTVWLGLTVGCATCHDHKFDPIAQKDFYAMAAFFRNTTQSPLDGNIYDTPPVMVVPSIADRPRWESLKSDLPRAHERLEAARASAARAAEGWTASSKRRKVRGGRFDESEKLALELSSKPALRWAGKAAPAQTHEAKSVTDPAGHLALEFGKNGYVEAPGVKPVAAGRPFTLAIRFRDDRDDEKAAMTLASQMAYLTDDEGDDTDNGWILEVVAGSPRLSFRSGRVQDFGMRGAGKRKVRPQTWHHLVVTYDGQRQREGISIYLDGEALPTERIGRALRVFDDEVAVEAPLVLGARDTRSDGKGTFLQGAIADFRAFDRALSHSEARLLAVWDAIESSAGKPVSALSERERQAHAEFYLQRRDAGFRQAEAALGALQAERRDILRRSPITHIQEEKADSPAMAHILHRGMYDQPGEEVAAATPGVLPPMAPDWPRNRLGLAYWLIDETNPLTARVAVNRFWQETFGAGLVRTAEDFGSQGEPPSHPELLDWLAVEFRESGWDVKALFRLMVTSAVYRQASVTTPEKLEKDPENRLLSRGPRFRMDGEVLRDAALEAGGLLSKAVGGPSVRPYQPPKIWETVAMKGSNTRFYSEDDGEALYRRSLYTFWKRAAPPPNMAIFNAPTREECTVRRERTNTPLQALVTMNDPQFFEAARGLAETTLAARGDFDARLDRMTARIVARPFEAPEREAASRSLREFLRYYDTNPSEARKAIAAGASRPNPKLDPTELAAWTLLANQLMNLDEALNK